MQLISIGQLAQQTDLAPSTLRYYESVGLLEPTLRESGQRRYNSAALQRLSVINLAKQAGFTLDEIKTLLAGFSEDTPPSARWKAMATQKMPEVEALITRAQDMKRILEEGLECDCLSLDQCAAFID
jgi:MerR family redox-sensitive transcriptional activator SoxR